VDISTIEQFECFIADDVKRKDLRIFRLINIESLSLWVKVKNLLAQKCPAQMKLSKFCAGDDLNPKINRLCAELETIADNTLLFPLSEHLRINNTKSGEILSQIVSIKYTNDVYSKGIHVYIPMYRMKDCLQYLLAQDRRLNDNIIFLEAQDRDDDYSLTIISRDIDVGIKGYTITGYKSYLAYWEDNPAKPIILFTDNAKYYKKTVFADNVKVLVNAFDIIKFHNLLPYNIDESMGEDWQWRDLLVKMKSENDINALLEKLLGIGKVNVTQLLSKWKDSGEFEKWLIWLWLKFETKTGYLYSVMSESLNYKELLQNIACGIFNYSIKDSQFREIYLERKNLIEALQIEELLLQFWAKLESIKDNEKIYYLTNCTKKEREQIISIIGKIDINSKLKEYLEYAYPSLYAYMGEYTLEDELITGYFKQYKLQKLQNVFTDEFVEKVSELAAQKGVWWKLKPRNNHVTNAYIDNAFIYWVDALGVEYLSLIQTLLDDKYKGVYYEINIGYAEIPTITEFNKDFVVDRKSDVTRTLDNLKHNGEYPTCIEEELRLIEAAVKVAVQKLDVFDRVIITSDHGASRGAILHKGTVHKSDDIAKVERFGRYCIQADTQYENRYAGCIDKDEYHIFANYDRFSISGNEKSEIHGGATLEEVLVPIIVLSKTSLEQKVIIAPLSTGIKPKAGELPKIMFKVDKQFNKLFATVEAKKYICRREADYWYFEPEVGKQECYVAKISSKGNIGEFEYKIVKGRTDNKKFDI